MKTASILRALCQTLLGAALFLIVLNNSSYASEVEQSYGSASRSDDKMRLVETDPKLANGAVIWSDKFEGPNGT